MLYLSEYLFSVFLLSFSFRTRP